MLVALKTSLSRVSVLDVTEEKIGEKKRRKKTRQAKGMLASSNQTDRRQMPHIWESKGEIFFALFETNAHFSGYMEHKSNAYDYI